MLNSAQTYLQLSKNYKGPDFTKYRQLWGVLQPSVAPQMGNLLTNLSSLKKTEIVESHWVIFLYKHQCV